VIASQTTQRAIIGTVPPVQPAQRRPPPPTPTTTTSSPPALHSSPPHQPQQNPTKPPPSLSENPSYVRCRGASGWVCVGVGSCPVVGDASGPEGVRQAPPTPPLHQRALPERSPCSQKTSKAGRSPNKTYLPFARPGRRYGKRCQLGRIRSEVARDDVWARFPLSPRSRAPLLASPIRTVGDEEDQPAVTARRPGSRAEFAGTHSRQPCHERDPPRRFAFALATKIDPGREVLLTYTIDLPTGREVRSRPAVLAAIAIYRT
jgi:hypothetical protein